MRVKSLALLIIAGNDSGFVNSFANPIALQCIGWKCSLVCVGWLVIELVAVWFFIVEKNGPTLIAICEILDALDHKNKNCPAGEASNTRVIL
jgi:hypothetical protein